MIDSLFFELIQVALNCRVCLSHPPQADEWGELYAIAKKQSLLGVCFAGVQRLVEQKQEPPKTLYLTWMGMAAKIQQRNEVVNKRCVELQERLSAEGLRSTILKGQGVGALYKVSKGFIEDSKSMKLSETPEISFALLRQSGDIDAWIDAPREEIIAYVKRVCANDDVDISSKHIEFRVFEDTEVEAHFVPAATKTPFISGRVKAFYESEKARQMEHRVMLTTGQEIVAPTNAFQAIHILQHAFGHFLFEGIGLRQLMDYYFVMQQPFTEEEKASIAKTMKGFGMYRFARGVAYVLREVFGDKKCFIPADEGLGKRILKSVMEEGNFGKYDEKRDDKKMSSSWYRFWYHNIRMWKYIDMAPWTIVMSPFMRIHEYAWRWTHGYFKKLKNPALGRKK